ncbi:serine-rich adhesin for platelets-like isoform X2 [Ptychodera flava]|uniref:serine-rich adhesin for platelets-like isoform X2 n=1 Tax=Ptychodera flava TaxID=63121 RepID=UPI00396A53BC
MEESTVKARLKSRSNSEIIDPSPTEYEPDTEWDNGRSLGRTVLANSCELFMVLARALAALVLGTVVAVTGLLEYYKSRAKRETCGDVDDEHHGGSDMSEDTYTHPESRSSVPKSANDNQHSEDMGSKCCGVKKMSKVEPNVEDWQEDSRTSRTASESGEKIGKGATGDVVEVIELDDFAGKKNCECESENDKGELDENCENVPLLHQRDPLIFQVSTVNENTESDDELSPLMDGKEDSSISAGAVDNAFMAEALINAGASVAHDQNVETTYICASTGEEARVAAVGASNSKEADARIEFEQSNLVNSKIESGDEMLSHEKYTAPLITSERRKESCHSLSNSEIESEQNLSSEDRIGRDKAVRNEGHDMNTECHIRLHHETTISPTEVDNGTVGCSEGTADGAADGEIGDLTLASCTERDVNMTETEDALSNECSEDGEGAACENESKEILTSVLNEATISDKMQVAGEEDVEQKDGVVCENLNVKDITSEFRYVSKKMPEVDKNESPQNEDIDGRADLSPVGADEDKDGNEEFISLHDLNARSDDRATLEESLYRREDYPPSCTDVTEKAAVLDDKDTETPDTERERGDNEIVAEECYRSHTDSIHSDAEEAGDKNTGAETVAESGALSDDVTCAGDTHGNCTDHASGDFDDEDAGEKSPEQVQGADSAITPLSEDNQKVCDIYPGIEVPDGTESGVNISNFHDSQFQSVDTESNDVAVTTESNDQPVEVIEDPVGYNIIATKLTPTESHFQQTEKVPVVHVAGTETEASIVGESLPPCESTTEEDEPEMKPDVEVPTESESKSHSTEQLSAIPVDEIESEPSMKVSTAYEVQLQPTEQVSSERVDESDSGQTIEVVEGDEIASQQDLPTVSDELKADGIPEVPSSEERQPSPAEREPTVEVDAIEDKPLNEVSGADETLPDFVCEASPTSENQDNLPSAERDSEEGTSLDVSASLEGQSSTIGTPAMPQDDEIVPISEELAFDNSQPQDTHEKSSTDESQSQQLHELLTPDEDDDAPAIGKNSFADEGGFEATPITKVPSETKDDSHPSSQIDDNLNLTDEKGEDEIIGAVSMVNMEYSGATVDIERPPPDESKSLSGDEVLIATADESESTESTELSTGDDIPLSDVDAAFTMNENSPKPIEKEFTTEDGVEKTVSIPVRLTASGSELAGAGEGTTAFGDRSQMTEEMQTSREDEESLSTENPSADETQSATVEETSITDEYQTKQTEAPAVALSQTIESCHTDEFSTSKSDEDEHTLGESQSLPLQEMSDAEAEETEFLNCESGSADEANASEDQKEVTANVDECSPDGGQSLSEDEVLAIKVDGNKSTASTTLSTDDTASADVSAETRTSEDRLTPMDEVQTAEFDCSQTKPSPEMSTSGESEPEIVCEGITSIESHPKQIEKVQATDTERADTSPMIGVPTVDENELTLDDGTSTASAQQASFFEEVATADESGATTTTEVSSVDDSQTQPTDTTALEGQAQTTEGVSTGREDEKVATFCFEDSSADDENQSAAINKKLTESDSTASTELSMGDDIPPAEIDAQITADENQSPPIQNVGKITQSPQKFVASNSQLVDVTNEASASETQSPPVEQSPAAAPAVASLGMHVTREDSKGKGETMVTETSPDENQSPPDDEDLDAKGEESDCTASTDLSAGDDNSSTVDDETVTTEGNRVEPLEQESHAKVEDDGSVTGVSGSRQNESKVKAVSEETSADENEPLSCEPEWTAGINENKPTSLIGSAGQDESQSKADIDKEQNEFTVESDEDETTPTTEQMFIDEHKPETTEEISNTDVNKKEVPTIEVEFIADADSRESSPDITPSAVDGSRCPSSEKSDTDADKGTREVPRIDIETLDETLPEGESSAVQAAVCEDIADVLTEGKDESETESEVNKSVKGDDQTLQGSDDTTTCENLQHEGDGEDIAMSRETKLAPVQDYIETDKNQVPSEGQLSGVNQQGDAVEDTVKCEPAFAKLDDTQTETGDSVTGAEGNKSHTTEEQVVESKAEASEDNASDHGENVNVDESNQTKGNVEFTDTSGEEASTSSSKSKNVAIEPGNVTAKDEKTVFQNPQTLCMEKGNGQRQDNRVKKNSLEIVGDGFVMVVASADEMDDIDTIRRGDIVKPIRVKNADHDTFIKDENREENESLPEAETEATVTEDTHEIPDGKSAMKTDEEIAADSETVVHGEESKPTDFGKSKDEDKSDGDKNGDTTETPLEKSETTVNLQSEALNPPSKTAEENSDKAVTIKLIGSSEMNINTGYETCRYGQQTAVDDMSTSAPVDQGVLSEDDKPPEFLDFELVTMDREEEGDSEDDANQTIGSENVKRQKSRETKTPSTKETYFGPIPSGYDSDLEGSSQPEVYDDDAIKRRRKPRKKKDLSRDSEDGAAENVGHTRKKSTEGRIHGAEPAKGVCERDEQGEQRQEMTPNSGKSAVTDKEVISGQAYRGIIKAKTNEAGKAHRDVDEQAKTVKGKPDDSLLKKGTKKKSHGQDFSKKETGGEEVTKRGESIDNSESPTHKSRSKNKLEKDKKFPKSPPLSKIESLKTKDVKTQKSKKPDSASDPRIKKEKPAARKTLDADRAVSKADGREKTTRGAASSAVAEKPLPVFDKGGQGDARAHSHSSDRNRKGRSNASSSDRRGRSNAVRALARLQQGKSPVIETKPAVPPESVSSEMGVPMDNATAPEHDSAVGAVKKKKKRKPKSRTPSTTAVGKVETTSIGVQVDSFGEGGKRRTAVCDSAVQVSLEDDDITSEMSEDRATVDSDLSASKGSLQKEHGGPYVTEFPYPTNSIPKLIGRKGKNIRQIASRTGTVITNRPSEIKEFHTIRVEAGHPKQLWIAMLAIQNSPRRD